ncbi:MAG: PH domain-containing protein [Sphaerochaetaceae bacterium]|jgi:hypothetical protein
MAGPKDYITQRMKELYVYELYGLRRELKPLSRVLYNDETINCFATGVSDGLRRMLVVTDSRVIIVGNHLGSPSDIDIIPRKDIVFHGTTKKLFASSIEFTTTNGAHYLLTAVSRRVLDLFDWALDQPIRQFDE